MKFMRYFVTAAGIMILIFMLLSCLAANFALGKLLTILMGLAMALWFNVPDNTAVKICKGLTLLAAVFFAVMTAVIALIPQTNRADCTEDAVIVLGCGVMGTAPTLTLARRLEKAIEYYNNNSDALIIVSGGQGPQEDITEAKAMYDYLTERGIPDESIIMEDKATSTNENFKLSKEILDKRLGSGYKTAYITNSFHSYRAGELAKLNGLDARAYNASTSITSIVPCYLREVLAVLQLWILGK